MLTGLGIIGWRGVRSDGGWSCEETPRSLVELISVVSVGGYGLQIVMALIVSRHVSLTHNVSDLMNEVFMDIGCNRTTLACDCVWSNCPLHWQHNLVNMACIGCC